MYSHQVSVCDNNNNNNDIIATINARVIIQRSPSWDKAGAFVWHSEFILVPNGNATPTQTDLGKTDLRLPTHLPTCLPIYLPTHVHTYIHLYIRTYIHNLYIRTYIHNLYICTYIHTQRVMFVCVIMVHSIMMFCVQLQS